MPELSVTVCPSLAGQAYGKLVGTPATLLVDEEDVFVDELLKLLELDVDGAADELVSVLDVDELDVDALLVVRMDVVADEFGVESVELLDRLLLELVGDAELVVSVAELELDIPLDERLVLVEVVEPEVPGTELELDMLLDELVEDIELVLLDDMVLEVASIEIELDMLLDELVDSMELELELVLVKVILANLAEYTMTPAG